MDTTIKNFESIKTFGNNIVKTLHVIFHLAGNATIAETLLMKDQLKELTLDEETKKSISDFTLKDQDVKYFFQIGYLALFSNFEFFMFDFLREFFLKFPKSLPKKTYINFEELSTLTSVKQIKEYIADKAAIDLSYSFEQWAQFINENCKISVFKTKSELDDMRSLNELRNAIMHSGGRVNSRFRNHIIKNLKVKSKSIKLNTDIKLDPEKYFSILYDRCAIIINNFKK